MEDRWCTYAMRFACSGSSRGSRVSTLATSTALPWFVFCIFVGFTAAESCNVCPNGEPISLPNKAFKLAGLPIPDCQGLVEASSFLDEEAAFCESIHQVSTLCGCSYDEETACSLCYDGTSVPLPLNEVPEYLASDFILGSPAGVVLNCETFEAILHQQEQNSSMCLDAQAISYHCGCRVPATSQNVTLDNDEADAETTVRKEDKDFCTLCIDGGTATLPDRPLELDGLPIQTCNDLISFAAFLEKESAECEGMQLIGSYCGCSYVRHDFSLCANHEPVPYPDKKMDWFDDLNDVPENFAAMTGSVNCGLFEASLQNLPGETFTGLTISFLHLMSRFKSGACGCDHGWQAKLMTWCYRVSGFLSCIGSLVIIIDVLLCKNKRRHTYHQLVLGMSSFDLLSSLAYTANTAMVPSDSGLYQVAGNDTTCAIQGFMLQWGSTSMVFNAILATYFLLVNNFNWKERVFRKIRVPVYIVTVLIGLGMALAGLWFYGATLATCYVTAPPVSETWWPISMLYIVPVGLSLLVATTASLLICHRVYKIELKSMKWSMRQDAALSKRVLMQTFWYLLSFYITVPASICLCFGGRTSWDGYSAFIIVAVIAPLQGLLNAFVYCGRQRTFISPWFDRLRERMCCSRKPRAAKEPSTAAFVDESLAGSGAMTVRTASRRSLIIQNLTIATPITGKSLVDVNSTSSNEQKGQRVLSFHNPICLLRPKLFTCPEISTMAAPKPLTPSQQDSGGGDDDSSEGEPMDTLQPTKEPETLNSYQSAMSGSPSGDSNQRASRVCARRASASSRLSMTATEEFALTMDQFASHVEHAENSQSDPELGPESFAAEASCQSNQTRSRSVDLSSPF